MMKRLLLTTIAVMGLASYAVAAPIALSDSQLGQTVAGNGVGNGNGNVGAFSGNLNGNWNYGAFNGNVNGNHNTP
jgi:hypothetical protein